MIEGQEPVSLIRSIRSLVRRTPRGKRSPNLLSLLRRQAPQGVLEDTRIGVGKAHHGLDLSRAQRTRP